MDVFNVSHPQLQRQPSSVRTQRKLRLLFAIIVAVFVACMVLVLLNFALNHKRIGEKLEVLHQSKQDTLSDVKCEDELCTTKDCVILASRLQELMDDKADPCEDFYQYACGNYQKTHSVPYNEEKFDPRAEVVDSILFDVKQLMEIPADDSDGEAKKKAKLIYSSCMNTSRRDDESVPALRRFLEEIDIPWFGTEVFWNETTAYWLKIVAKVETYGVHTFFRTRIVNEEWEYENLNMSISFCDVTILPKSTYLSSRESDNSYQLAIYREVINNVLRLLDVEADTRKEILNEILDLETILAGASEEMFRIASGTAKAKRTQYSCSKDSSNELNLTSDEQDQWTEFLKVLLESENANPDDVKPLTIYHCIEKLPRIIRVLNRTPSKVVYNYLGWRLVFHVLKYMGQEFRDIYNHYVGLLPGSHRIYLSTWKQCAALVMNDLDLVAAKTYVDAGKFTKANEEEIHELLVDLKAAFAAVFRSIEWLGNGTKEQFLDKLKRIEITTSYEDAAKEIEVLDVTYSELHIDESASFFSNIMELQRFNFKDSLNKLIHLYDGSGYRSHMLLNHKQMHPYIGYARSAHKAYYYLGTFRQPLFTLGSDIPRYLKYGQSVPFAHELSHAFDTKGNLYDGNGTLTGIDWWPDVVKYKFHQFVTCLIGQYSQFPIDGTGKKVNGQQTLDENLTDLGTIFITYTGLAIHLRSHGDEKSLPGISLNKKQTHFVQTAQFFCEVREKPHDVRNEMDIPAKYRVNGVLANIEEFGAAFSCPVGSPMNPQRKCNLRQ